METPFSELGLIYPVSEIGVITTKTKMSRKACVQCGQLFTSLRGEDTIFCPRCNLESQERLRVNKYLKQYDPKKNKKTTIKAIKKEKKA